MDREDKTIIVIIAVIVLFIGGAAFVLFGDRDLSIAYGDEGYVPLDPLLFANTYDRAIWIYTPGVKNCVTRHSVEYCANPYDGVSANDGSIQIAPTYGIQTLLQTKNLRLVDTKFTFAVQNPDHPRYGGQACLSTNKGIIKCLGRTSYTGEPRYQEAGIELLWNDYALGQYQLKVNGAIVQQGTIAETDSLYFILTPKYAYGQDFEQATPIIKNPIVKSLFSCDLQAGEVITNVCYQGPATIDREDLPAFRRFCTNYPAKIVDNGLDRASKQVYYDLAASKSVTIKTGEIYEFQYIADNAALGLPVDKTGIANQCDDALLVDDLKDLPVEEPRVTGTSLEWTSYATFSMRDGLSKNKDSLLTGTTPFMTVSTLGITCPYKTTTQSYPGVPASCFTISSYGKTFTEGTKHQISPSLNVTLKKLTVAFKESATRGKMYTYTARWQLDFASEGISNNVTATKDLVTVTTKNNLPSTATVSILVVDKQRIIGETKLEATKISIPSGSSIVSKLSYPDQIAGDHDLGITSVLQTDAGTVAFKESLVSSGSTTTKLSWWQALIVKIKGLWRW